MRARRRWVPGLALLAAAWLGAVWLLWEPGAGSALAPASQQAAPSVAGEGLAPSRVDLPDPSSRPIDIEVLPKADAPAAAAPGATADAPRASALVRGRVLDQDGVAVPSVTLSLYRGSTKLQTTADAGGSFQFADLGPGLYRLFVERYSLPDGLLPPWKQQLSRDPEDNPTGIFGTAFRLTAGLERQIDLRVFAAGDVSGRIVGPHGDPIAGALVSVRSPTGVVGSGATDDSGRFAIEQLYAGAYTTTVRLGAGLPEAQTAAPLPVRFELAPRQSLVLADQLAGSGGHILRGQIVDLAGQPVRGVPIECREEREDGQGGLWSCVTNDAGRFEIGRVPSAALVVGLGPQAGRDADDARIEAEGAPLRLDTRSAREVVELEAIRVRAPRPFRVLGRLSVDPEWAATIGLERWKARVLVNDIEASGAHSGDADGAEEDDDALPAERGSPVSASGAFTWTCVTPHPEVELTIVLRNDAGAEIERRQRVQPVADETRELVVSIP